MKTWILRQFAAALLATVAITSAGLALDRGSYQRPRSIPAPPDNPTTPERAALGQMLFFDPRLSSSGSISCATCHNPSFAWGDRLPLGVGHGHVQLSRRTPTILNAAFNEVQMWDGRFESLEEQALGPMTSAAEMNNSIEAILATLGSLPDYVRRFEAAFPGEGVNRSTLAKAIAAYERTIVSGTAPFDRWVAGDETAISAEAKRGFELFNTKARCANCHSGWNFTDSSFHDIGVASADRGRGPVLGIPELDHAFKTPTLRNVEQRAPYMHNGSERTLREVVELYNAGGRVQRPTLSTEIVPLGLSDPEMDALVAFLRTLTSNDPPVALPALP